MYVCIFFFFGVVRAQGDEVRRNTGGAFSSLSLSLSSPSPSPSSSCDGCSISTKLPASGLARASSAARGVCTQHGSRSRRLKAVKGVHAKRTRQAFSRSAHRQPMMTSTAVGCWATGRAALGLHALHTAPGASPAGPSPLPPSHPKFCSTRRVSSRVVCSRRLLRRDPRLTTTVESQCRISRVENVPKPHARLHVQPWARDGRPAARVIGVQE